MKVRPKKLSLALARAFGTGVAVTLVSTPVVLAQSTDAQAPRERLEVTGTRIPAPNLEGASPVTVIDAEAIRLEGVRSTENLLNNLPQVFADQGGNLSNGATGTATINLRSLGNNRTLVLQNGRRLPPGSFIVGGYAPDVNQIPTPLIKRVEVLTGGASAVYGSDAVAGVVNFIMQDNFEGAQAQINYSFYNHYQQQDGIQTLVRNSGYQVPGDKSDDGQETDVSALIGGNFANGKGNATIFFQYQQLRGLTQSERDFSACTLASNAAGFTCGGSTTTTLPRFILPGGTPPQVVNSPTGSIRPYVGATDAFNFAPYNYYQRPQERYQFNAFAHYDINPNMRVYDEFNFMDNKTDAQIAPSGLFGVLTNVAFENPLLSAAERTFLGLTKPGDVANNVLIQKRNVEGGGRDNNLRLTTFRNVIGLTGDFAKYWNYDLYEMESRVAFQQVYKHDFSIAKSGLALDVITDPATGQPACRAFVTGADTNCVPYNIWATGKITPQALAYLETPLLSSGYTSISMQSGSVSSDLGSYGVKLPWAKSGVAVAFGLERRVEKLNRDVDNSFLTGDGAGQGGQTLPVNGSTTVNDFFAEVRAPLIEGQNWANLLQFNGSYRRSDYQGDNNVNSYGLGLEWAPIQTIRARGSYQQTVRAANILELFAAQGNALFAAAQDDCAGPTPARPLSQCARTGVTAAQYGKIPENSAGQYNQLVGGNPNLKPETGKSTTFGVVLTPWKDFSATIDYFRIKVTDVVGTVPANTTLANCYNTGDPVFCNLVRRDAVFASLWLPGSSVSANNQNLGSLKTSGVDFGANYTYRMSGWGNLNVDFIGTWLKEFVNEPVPGGGSFDCAGLHGAQCGVPLPEWRHKLRFTWGTPWSADVALTWRYLSSVDTEGTSSNPLLNGPVNPADRKLSAQHYIDLSSVVNLSKTVSFVFGINNLFDNDPPFINNSQIAAVLGNGNTYPQVYDALGRHFFLNLTAKF